MSENQPAHTPTHFIQIDEEGYFLLNGIRASDESSGRRWLAKMQMSQGRAMTDVDGTLCWVEAFDEPYLVLDCSPRDGELWTAKLPYGHEETFRLSKLSLDEWDRFHGHTERGIPFVFSRAAQAGFFNALDEFDDESVTYKTQSYVVGPWLTDNHDAQAESWWSDLYRAEDMRWDLKAPSHALPTLVPRLKLQRCRVLVAGAGSGSDAAWLAEQGHIVTAIDFSPEAVARMNKQYGHLGNLRIVQANIFDLPTSLNGSFDLIFEHTLYCAIAPSRRNELVKVWQRLLAERGHLMGVFFTFDKAEGPPFGGSEWEIRARLSKGFRPLYWQRLRDSRPERLGRELFLYAEKLTAL